MYEMVIIGLVANPCQYSFGV